MILENVYQYLWLSPNSKLSHSHPLPSQEAENRGISPEEVCAAVVSCRNSSNTNPCDWLNLELPHLLDEICIMATSIGTGQIQYDNYNAGDSGTADATKAHGETTGQGSPNAVVGVEGAELQLSRAEAKRAWLAAGGHIQPAVKRLLGTRRANVRPESKQPAPTLPTWHGFMPL